jgi:hypothetical protein
MPQPDGIEAASGQEAVAPARVWPGMGGCTAELKLLAAYRPDWILEVRTRTRNHDQRHRPGEARDSRLRPETRPCRSTSRRIGARPSGRMSPGLEQPHCRTVSFHTGLRKISRCNGSGFQWSLRLWSSRRPEPWSFALPFTAGRPGRPA